MHTFEKLAAMVCAVKSSSKKFPQHFMQHDMASTLPVASYTYVVELQEYCCAVYSRFTAFDTNLADLFNGKMQ